MLSVFLSDGIQTLDCLPLAHVEVGRPSAPPAEVVQQTGVLLPPVSVPGRGTVGILTMPTSTAGVSLPLTVASDVHLKRGAVSVGVGVAVAKIMALARNSRIGNCILSRTLLDWWRID